MCEQTSGACRPRNGLAAVVVVAVLGTTGGARAQDDGDQRPPIEPDLTEPLEPETPLRENTEFATPLEPGPVAGEGASPEESPPGPFDALVDAIVGGDVTFDLRARAEIVEQDGTDTAQAYTERIRLGYGSKPFHGLSFYLDFEDIRAADYDLYNAAGLNGEPDKAVVADPEDTELNQFFGRFESGYFGAIAGRQRITLDDHRFVGNVGWRQNEQTYDAYTLTSSWLPGTAFFYSYVDDVNRVFGPDADLDFDSDSHLVNVAYTGLPIGKLTGFGYFLDFDNSDVNSSNSFGLRLSGSVDLPVDLAIEYAASYAYQIDAGENPVDYEASYYFVEGAIAQKGLGKLGVGYEVLGSDDGDFAFRTPLATLHKFNGWADLFLVTPNDGLEDLYFFAGADLPFDIKSLAVYHLFFSEDRSRDLGGELDALLSKKLGEHVNLLAKLAVFHSESEVPQTQKYWLECEVKF